MPSPTPANAALAALPHLTPNLHPLGTLFDFLDSLNWMALTDGGYEVVVNRVANAALGTVDFLATGGVPPEDAVEITAPNTRFLLCRVAGDFKMDALVAGAYSGPINNMVALQVDGKIYVLQKELNRVLIEGDPAANEPIGVRRMATVAQTITATPPDGGEVTFGNISQAITLLTGDNGWSGTAALVMNLDGFRKWLNLHYTAGLNPRVAVDPVTGRECYFHETFPVLINPNIPSNEQVGAGPATRTSYYLVVRGYPHGLYGAFSPGADGSMIQTERVLLTGTDTSQYRVGAICTFVLGSEGSLVRINGIAT